MPKHFKEDFATANAYDQHWFIHEMAHVWQYQLGMNVRLRGLASWAVSISIPCPIIIFYPIMEWRRRQVSLQTISISLNSGAMAFK